MGLKIYILFPMKFNNVHFKLQYLKIIVYIKYLYKFRLILNYRFDIKGRNWILINMHILEKENLQI